MTPTDPATRLSVFFDLVGGAQAIIKRRHASPEYNLAKLEEEAGELARTAFHPSSREEIINEVADVIIAAAAQGTFVRMTPEELAEALTRKLAKAVSLPPLKPTDNLGHGG